tara:strand:- start:483 stop:872 length:390 start_codon:yes stop_codon:yes gene_type:complete
MSVTEPCVNSWVSFLNTQDAATVASFLHDDIIIIAYQQGPEGPSTEHQGIAAVVAWVQYPPKDLFVFEVTSTDTFETPDAETSVDTCLSATYQVSHTKSDFRNQGKWTFFIGEGLIRRILHVPDALTED